MCSWALPGGDVMCSWALPGGDVMCSWALPEEASDRERGNKGDEGCAWIGIMITIHTLH